MARLLAHHLNSPLVVHQRFIEPLESILQKNPKTFITQDDIKKIFSVIRSVAFTI